MKRYFNKSRKLILIKPEDSLIIGDEDLNTILEKETDEAIKSSVKDLVLIPSGDVDEIGLLLYHDLSTFKMSVVSILEGFTDESPLEENDDLFELESKKNDWKKILYDAPIDDLMTEDKFFDPGGDINEIDAFLKFDVSTDIKDGFHGSKGDVIYLESSLSDDTIPNPHPEVFIDCDSRSLSDINDVKIMVKVFDPEIHEKKFSPTYDCLDFKDSRARGFVHRSISLQSLACFYMGIRYSRSY
nr:hypothetical protein [Tanacetum cinerariifolium]